MKRSILYGIVLLTVFVFGSASVASQRKPIDTVNTDHLINDTQIRSSGGDNHICAVWWIPSEFWGALMAKDTATPEENKNSIINALKPYFIVAVIQADISDFGAFHFYNKEEVMNTLQVTYVPEDGTPYQAVPLKTIDPDVDIMLAMFKPVLKASMGNLGENLHFFVLQDIDLQNVRIIDPYKFGKIHFRLGWRNGEPMEANLELPVNALFIPRICPNGKDAHVTWKYCPWTGEKLPDIEQ